jgi:site-specific recombinase XerD
VATQWFKLFRQGIGIPDKNENDLKLVFHSFRHTFVSMVRSTGLVDTWSLQLVVGHEKRGEGTTDIYSHLLAISNLRRVVDAIDYFD